MPSRITSHWPTDARTGNWKIAGFGVAVVVLFLSATGLALHREREAMQDQAVVNSANLARATEEHVVSTVRTIDQMLNDVVRDYRRNPDGFDFRYWVRNSEMMLDPAATHLEIANEKGVVVLTRTGDSDAFVGDQQHFIVQRDHTVEGLFISIPVAMPGSDRWTIQFTRRLERPDGSFAGIVALGLDTTYFTDFYKSIRVGDEGALSLIGRDGIIRARLVGNDTSTGQSLRTQELYRRLDTMPVGSFHAIYATDRVDRIVSYRCLTDYPLVVTVGFSIAEILEPYEKFRHQVLVAAILISASTLLIAVILNGEIFRRQKTEHLLATVVAAAPATIQMKDTDLRIRWANRAFVDLYSADAPTPVGKRINELPAHIPAIDAIHETDREVLRTGRGLLDLAQYLPATQDRAERHLSVSKTPIFGANGDISHILTIGTDVTALRCAEANAAAARIAERAAQVGRAEISDLLSGMPTAVYRGTFGRDRRFSISFVSDNVSTITGRSADEIAGPAGWYDYLGPDRTAEIATFFARLTAIGESQTEYRLPGPQGVWIRDRARVAARNGDMVEIIGNWTDISREYAITEKAMENAKLATLGELATGLAHELNQSIAVMSLCAENAADALDGGESSIPAARLRVARIIQQAQRAAEIVSHLRIFGRNDIGPLEPIRLVDAVTGAIALTDIPLRDEHIQIKTQLSPDLPMAMGRLTLIENVLVNLIMNARDAMRDIAVERRVLRIEAATLPRGRIALRVTDQGGGIPPHVMPRLFEPFFTTKSTHEGTGLGLSLSHGMMRAMDGDISVANIDGGASFVLILRVAVPEYLAGLGSSASHAVAYTDRDR